jgi:hypothetical protein
VNSAALPRANRQSANDLRGHGEVILAEFRPTEKRKKFRWGKNQLLAPNASLHG